MLALAACIIIGVIYSSSAYAKECHPMHLFGLKQSAVVCLVLVLGTCC